MNIVFRGFQASDTAEVEQMMMALYQEDPEGEALTHQKIHTTMTELTQHPEKGRIVVFTSENHVVGYALLIFYWSNEFGGDILCLDELYVKIEWRNRGIGTQFLKWISTTDQFGTPQGLQLEVTPSNHRALRLYQKLGFDVSPNTHLFKKVNFS